MSSSNTIDRPAVIDRLSCALNAHDVESLVACFHSDYESLHPLHPERNSQGLAGVRHSWACVFDAIPDFQAELCRCAVAGDEVWTEWQWQGKHVDGPSFYAGGVMIFGLADDQLRWARVYTETVQIIGPDFDQILEEILSREAEW